jgi:hypothetical protein
MKPAPGRPGTCGHPRQANNLAPFQNDILWTSRPTTGLVNLLKARANISDNFRRNSFACGKEPVFNITIPTTVPVRSLRPFRLALPGSCLALLPLWPTLVPHHGRTKLVHETSLICTWTFSIITEQENGKSPGTYSDVSHVKTFGKRLHGNVKLTYAQQSD